MDKECGCRVLHGKHDGECHCHVWHEPRHSEANVAELEKKLAHGKVIGQAIEDIGLGEDSVMMPRKTYEALDVQVARLEARVRELEEGFKEALKYWEPRCHSLDCNKGYHVSEYKAWKAASTLLTTGGEP